MEVKLLRFRKRLPLHYITLTVAATFDDSDSEQT